FVNSNNYQREDDVHEFFIDFNSSIIFDQWAVTKTAIPRDYWMPVTPEEKENITYIITTLAENEPVFLLKHKNRLEKAGAKINHLHPLRYLYAIFSDEELKVGMRNIRSKNGLAWSGFVKGCEETLTEEAARSNVRVEHVVNF